MSYTQEQTDRLVDDIACCVVTTLERHPGHSCLAALVREAIFAASDWADNIPPYTIDRLVDYAEKTHRQECDVCNQAYLEENGPSEGQE